MKQCGECNEKRNGIKIKIYAGFDGIIKRVALCPTCRIQLEKTGFLYKTTKDDMNIGVYIKRAQQDMKKLKERQDNPNIPLLMKNRK